jgi:hypothetical protein
MAQATIRLQALGGGWETVGVDRLRAIKPEGIQLSANDWGSDTCRFMLRRDPKGIHPDLSAFTPCDVEIDGKLVWSGRVWETPTKDGSDASIAVEGRGWQYHLDDDLFTRTYVHARMSDFIDARSRLTTDLAQTIGVGQLANDGALVLTIPQGATIVTGKYQGCHFIDLGPDPACWAKRVVTGWQHSNNMSSAYIYVRGLDTPEPSAAGLGSEAAWPGGYNNFVNGVTLTGGASGTTAASTARSTGYRYLAVFLYYNNPTVAVGADVWFRLSSLLIFGETAYESGNASALKASDVAKDVLSRAPLLSQDQSLISATSFSIPEFHFAEDRTPREVVAAINAYHNYRCRIDVDRRLRFDPYPSSPRFEAGGWQGTEFEDASANSGESIYNRAISNATDHAGQQLHEVRTAGPNSLPTRRGFNRSAIVPVQTALSSAAAIQILDTFLAGHISTPLRGGMAVEQGGVRLFNGGSGVHPSALLRETGELVRFLDRRDPDTGGLGRDGRIASVSYDHDAERASVAIDNERRNFEALLARLAIVQGGS